MKFNFFSKKKIEISERYNFLKNLKKFKKLKKNKKLIIGVTVGRSGMKWVLEILKAHKNIYGGGERNSTCESFFRYAKHNRLNVDETALLNSIICETLNDWKQNDISFQLSPYFSHSLDSIEKNLNPDGYIWGINDAQFTIQSFYNKGWYYPDYNFTSGSKVPGFSLSDRVQPNHFFGRIVPKGKYYKTWLKLTRIGKISWYVNLTNKIIYNSLKQINDKKIFIFILNKGDQNYKFYLKLIKWLKIKKKIDLKKFLKIKFMDKTMFRAIENKKKNFSNKEKNEMKFLTKDFNKIYEKVFKVTIY